jgi:hypothetical protein
MPRCAARLLIGPLSVCAFFRCRNNGPFAVVVARRSVASIDGTETKSH